MIDMVASVLVDMWRTGSEAVNGLIFKVWKGLKFNYSEVQKTSAESNKIGCPTMRSL